MDSTRPEIGHDVHITEVVSAALGFGPLDPQDHLFDLFREKLDEVHYLATQAREDPSKLSGEHHPVDLQKLDADAETWEVAYAKAVAIYNALLTEVDGAMHGRSNWIDLTNDAKDPSQACMTKQSAHKWLSAFFEIEIPEWAPPKAASGSPDKEMSISEREKFQITLAVLTKLYAEAKGSKFGSLENPTVTAVADALTTAIELEGAHRTGLSAKTTGDRLSEALKVLKQSK